LLEWGILFFRLRVFFFWQASQPSTLSINCFFPFQISFFLTPTVCVFRVFFSSNPCGDHLSPRGSTLHGRLLVFMCPSLHRPLRSRLVVWFFRALFSSRVHLGLSFPPLTVDDFTGPSLGRNPVLPHMRLTFSSNRFFCFSPLGTLTFPLAPLFEEFLLAQSSFCSPLPGYFFYAAVFFSLKRTFFLTCCLLLFCSSDNRFPLWTVEFFFPLVHGVHFFEVCGGRVFPHLNFYGFFAIIPCFPRRSPPSPPPVLF